jgi:hypothetical protein
MSRLLGSVLCSRCRSDEFRLENRETYISVLCRSCGAKAGELSNTFSSAPDPTAHPLLGRRVEVILRRAAVAEPELIARGTLLRYSAMGECVLSEDDGDVHWCWPMLEIRAANSPPPPEMDPLMSCPCGRGDYALCRNCPYPSCSVHGMGDG